MLYVSFYNPPVCDKLVDLAGSNGPAVAATQVHVMTREFPYSRLDSDACLARDPAWLGAGACPVAPRGGGDGGGGGGVLQLGGESPLCKICTRRRFSLWYVVDLRLFSCFEVLLFVQKCMEHLVFIVIRK